MIGEIELLTDAIRKGDIETVRAALREKPALAHQRGGYFGWMLIHQAAHLGATDIVQLLLAHGADVHARDKGDNATPLHLAAGNGHLDTVMALTVAGADVNCRDDWQGVGPLGWATIAGYQPTVAEFLVNAGAEIGFFPAIAMNRPDDVARCCAEDESALDLTLGDHVPYGRPLHFAARRGRARIVEQLIALGADPNERDWVGLTPLAIAAFYGRSDVAARLEAGGAMLDLGAAIALGRDDEATHLLAQRRDQIHGDGAYARLLHYAAQNGHLEAARFLMDQGADPDARIEWWRGHRVAPLHLASSNGHSEIVRLFAHRGADLLIEDSRYKSAPRGWAIEHRQDALASLLRELEPE